jgi:hypothetical protein
VNLHSCNTLRWIFLDRGQTALGSAWRKTGVSHLLIVVSRPLTDDFNFWPSSGVTARAAITSSNPALVQSQAGPTPRQVEFALVELAVTRESSERFPDEFV